MSCSRIRALVRTEKDSGSQHIETLMIISGDVTTSSLYNITAGIYEQQSWYLSDFTCYVI